MWLYKVTFKSGAKRRRQNIVEIVAKDEEHAKNKILSRHYREAKKGLKITKIEPIKAVITDE